MYKEIGKLVVILIVIGILIGWVINLIEVIQYLLSDIPLVEISALMVVKIIGIIVPFIGGILGYV